MTDPSNHLFWITSRAAGSAALVTASVSVGIGLMMGGRLVKGAGRGGDLRALHEALSLATLAAIAVHGIALLGDSFLRPSIVDIAVPFAGRYRPFWTGIGVAAGWALAALGLSYYARARIGQQRWRKLHRLTAVAWLLGVVHSLTAGTDAGTTWFVIMCAACAIPVAVLLLARLAAGADAPAARPAPASGGPARTPATARRTAATAAPARTGPAVPRAAAMPPPARPSTAPARTGPAVPLATATAPLPPTTARTAPIARRGTIARPNRRVGMPAGD